MTRYIDADELYMDLVKMQAFGELTAKKAIRAVENAPTIKAEPVKHEECEYFITKGKAGYNEEYKCSVCGDSFYWTQDRFIPRRFNYCRNCGRKVIRFIEKEVNTAGRKSK